MKELTEEEAISLLKKYSNSTESFEKVLEHVKAVQKIALRIASKIKGIDMYKIKIGSLLHDIGRFSCSREDTVKHGLMGGEILRKEGLTDIAEIAERHLGAGITKKEITERDLPLPHHDFIPETREEKIIAHADNLIFGSKEGSFEDVVERYREEIGEECVRRVVKLKEEVDKMINS